VPDALPLGLKACAPPIKPNGGDCDSLFWRYSLTPAFMLGLNKTIEMYAVHGVINLIIKQIRA